MQVKHESQLLEPNLLDARDFQLPNGVQSLEGYTLHNQSLLGPIELIAISPNCSLIAVYLSSSNQMLLIDGKSRSRRVKFALKSCDNKRFSRQSFRVKGLDFSPDSSRLAVGQTDCIIYVYKISPLLTGSSSQQLSASESDSISKPTITGKFVCSSPVTCLSWTEFGIVFGTQDGKIKLIYQQSTSGSKSTLAGDGTQPSSTSTKVIPLYSSPRATMPLLLANRGPQLALSFLDGSVVVTVIPTDQLATNELSPSSHELAARRTSSMLQLVSQVSYPMKQNCPPVYLGLLLNNTLCYADCDGRLSFSSVGPQANPEISMGSKSSSPSTQNMDLKESLVALDYSPINELIAVATLSRLLFIKHEQESNRWQLEPSSIQLGNSIALTSVRWCKDGAELLIGTASGSLELFSCNWNKQSIGEQVDICHIAKNRVRISDRARNLLATYKSQHDIKRVNLLDNGQSVIIWTTNSLLLARLANPMLQSELLREKGDKNFATSSNIKFTFEHPGFVLVYRVLTREIQVVKLGQDSILYRAKLVEMCKSTLSARQYPLPISIKTAYCTDLSPYRQRSAGLASRSSIASVKDHQQEDKHESNDELSLNRNQVVPSEQTAELGSQIERFAYATNKNLYLIDLKSGSQEIEYQHSESVCWLSLSHTNEWLVLRDTADKLLLIPIKTKGDRTVSIDCKLLLNQCQFAGWLPNSDILVAQSNWQICIWFSMNEPQHMETTDARCFNLTNSAPIIDLSIVTNAKSGHKGRGQWPKVSRINSDSLSLSNGCSVALDQMKVKFYSKVAGSSGRLDEVLDLLEQSRGPLTLWSKLGWLAIERDSCEVAIKAFKRLNYKSLVSYLDRCLSNEMSHDERKIRLAKLRGDWRTFEQLSEPDEILATYKRLCKWSLAIDYLTQTQQFRQRDLLETEQREWLIDRGRYLDAARIQSKAGDIEGATELLLDKGKNLEAVELLLAEEKSISMQNLASNTNKLNNLIEQLKSKLTAQGKLGEAARLCDRLLAQKQDAVELYLKAELLQEALNLAQQVSSKERVREIEALVGESLLIKFRAYRLSRRAALASVDHLLASGCVPSAMSAAIELRDFSKAFGILESSQDSISQDECKKYSLLIADHLLESKIQVEETGDERIERAQLLRMAISALMVGQHFGRLVRLYLEEGELESAYEISLEHLHSGARDKVDEEFCRIADQLVQSIESNADGQADEQVSRAERIYLVLNRPDLAIDMHRRLKRHSRMLELIELHQPELMEDTLLQLAKEAESRGELEVAEGHLLRASPAEWTNVVRMYRLNNRWDEAYRVAKANCASERDPLLVQLAYWWAKSLVSQSKLQEARVLLTEKLNILSQVIEFCVENKSFQIAIKLCQNGQVTPGSVKEASPLRDFVVKRYAMYLAEQHKLKSAEELLVEHGLIEEAARIYIDDEQPSEAIRLVESQLAGARDYSTVDEQKHLSNLLQKTLIDCANQLLTKGPTEMEDSEKLQSAQQMYLRAQRPDLAVAMYRERGMWQEAMRVAQRFAPHLLEEVELAFDEQFSQDLKPILTAVSADNKNPKRLESQQQQPREGEGGKKSSAIEQAPSDYLQLKVEERMRNGDQRGTKAALEQFLSSLDSAGRGKSDPSRLDIESKVALSQIDDWLQQLMSESSQVKLSLLSSDALQRLLDLVERAISSCLLPLDPISCGTTDEDETCVWIEFRNLLLECLDFIRSNLVSSSTGDPLQLALDIHKRLHEYLLMSHLLVLQGFLAGQLIGQQAKWNKSASLSLVLCERLGRGAERTATGRAIADILGKVSLTILECSSWPALEPLGAHYNVARWSLASGRRELARSTLSKLLELAADETATFGELELGPNSSISAHQLEEARNWLLSDLIGSDRPASKLKVEMSDLKREPRPLDSVCLVCGLASNSSARGTDRHELLQLGQRVVAGQTFIYQVHTDEWRLLESLCASNVRPPAELVSNGGPTRSDGYRTRTRGARLSGDPIGFVLQLANTKRP